MPAQQTMIPKAAAQAGVLYGFDPANPNLLNAMKIGNDGGLVTADSKGSGAATITTDTTVVSGSFVAITILNDAVFTSLTRSNTTGTIGSVTVPAGVTLFGTFTGYQLASGAVIAYGA